MEFKDKVAIVTGGTRGIGRAIALELARKGCNVAFTYSKNKENAETLVKEIESMGTKAVSFQSDAASLEGAKTVVKAVKDTFGRIDFLVNNAGITRDKLLALMGKMIGMTLSIPISRVFIPFSKAVIMQMIKQKGVVSLI